MPTINDSVQFLKGVGPAFAKKFEKLGILTIRDLLLCYPRKYIDYTQPYTVVSAPYDVECCVRATVLQKEPARRVKGGRVMNRVLRRTTPAFWRCRGSMRPTRRTSWKWGRPTTLRAASAGR